MKRKRSFSLIELLVVIGIIALLCSLLLPALAKSKRVVLAIACGNNLKQLSIALASYNNDYTVLPAPYTSAWAGSYITWSGKLYHADLLKTTKPLYWGAYSANCDIMRCGEAGGLEYGMNAHLANLMGVVDTAGHTSWNETFLRPEKILRPATRLLLGESSNFIIGGPTTAAGPNGFANYPHTGTSMNALFLDYHVERLHRSQMVWAFYSPLFGDSN